MINRATHKTVLLFLTLQEYTHSKIIPPPDFPQWQNPNETKKLFPCAFTGSNQSKNFASEICVQMYYPEGEGWRTNASWSARCCPKKSGAEREEGREDGERSCRRLSWSEQGRNMERRILTLIYIASMSPQSRPSPTPTFLPLRSQRV